MHILDSHFLISMVFSTFFPCGGLLRRYSDSEFSISALNIKKEMGRPYKLPAVNRVYVRCAMAHWLITLSSIGQWLIVSRRLGTQDIFTVSQCLMSSRSVILNFCNSNRQVYYMYIIAFFIKQVQFSVPMQLIDY